MSNQLTRESGLSPRLVLLVAIGAGLILAILPLLAGPYPQTIARTVLIYMMLSLSWDMLVRSGQLSFGIAGFFGLGGYVAAIGAKYLGIPPVLTILFAALLTALIAAGIGAVVLRLRGMYFAIVTLALAEIFRVIAHNWKSLTDGPNGMLLPEVAFNGDSVATYFMILVLAALVIGASEWFRHSRIYYAITAIRNDETVAKSSGINIYLYLLIVFAITSGIQGAVGAGYTQLFGFVTPDSSFHVNFTLIPLAMTLLGGMYGTWGPVVGSILLGVLGEYLKLVIPYGHLVVYGLIIVFVLLFMPQGIVGLIKARTRRGGDR
ncbi:MAG: branched-chain amino acid ABC transporter permease [Alkalispirochaeta sp.]